MTKVGIKTYQQNDPLQNLEDRNYDLRKQYNAGFLTFMGFLITTNGVIISVENISDCVKYCLCISTILLVIGLAIFFYISSLETKRIDKSMKYMRNWSMSDKLGNMNEEIEILNKIRKKSFLENFGNIFYRVCLGIGIFSFLLGIIIFMFSL